MILTRPFPKTAVCFVLHLFLFQFAFPLTGTYAEPDSYGPFELKLESPQTTYTVGEELGIRIIISHTYPATLPGTFVVELHRKGLKEWEYLINVDALLPRDNEFTLKKFGVPAFNTEDSSAGDWRIRVFPLRDKEKAQEIGVTILENPLTKLHKGMNITRALTAADELSGTLKKRGYLELGNQMAEMISENSGWENYGNLAAYFNSLDLKAYSYDIRRQAREIALALERVSKLDMDDFVIKKGDRYVVPADTVRTGTAQRQFPPPGNFECTIPAGTVLVTTHDKPSGALSFDLVPEQYEQLETKLVPRNIRNTPEYRGYQFTFTVEEIGEALHHENEQK
ncbi:MAG: hypothetical protein AB7S78_02640 [Candidatus Omnitrophota bacterium]